MKLHRCVMCAWFDQQHKSLPTDLPNLGYCRKHKPIVYEDGKFYRGGWPLVDVDDFCGEFIADVIRQEQN